MDAARLNAIRKLGRDYPTHHEYVPYDLLSAVRELLVALDEKEAETAALRKDYSDLKAWADLTKSYLGIDDD